MLQHPSLKDGRILVESTVIGVISQYLQVAPGALEAGGILVGYRRANHLHVIALTEPHPKDRRSVTSFERISPFHQERALALWKQSGGKMDYLGEWHTHPERTPSPSGIDRREWRKLYFRRQSPLIFMIAGTEGSWYGMGQGTQLHPCLPLEDSHTEIGSINRTAHQEFLGYVEPDL